MTLVPRRYPRARAVAARALRAILAGGDPLGWLAVLGVELAPDGLASRADLVIDAGCSARVRRAGCRPEFATFGAP